MLMNTIMKTYREITGQVETAQPIETLPITEPAANAGRFAKAGMQARRQRRLRRQVTATRRVNHGWSVRAW
jgi:hypothetical protein